MLLNTFLWFPVLFSMLSNVSGDSMETLEKTQQRLISDLFVDYNPSVRPNETVDISICLTVEHFRFLDSNGAFSFSGLIKAEWQDKKLHWNTSDYMNTTRISVPQRLVWLPDLEFFNNDPEKFLRTHRKGFVSLESNGSVSWQDNLALTTFCRTDFYHWPHEQHFCYLHLGSWTHYGNQINLLNNKQRSLRFAENIWRTTGYRITSNYTQRATIEYFDVGEKYTSLYFTIKFHRKAQCALIFRTHAFTVMLLILAAHQMNGSRKIGLLGLSLVLITTQLIYFTGKIGKFTRSIPKIVKFYSYSFTLVTLAMVIEVLFAWISLKCRANAALPKYLAILLQNPFHKDSPCFQWFGRNRRTSSKLIPSDTLEKSFRDFDVFLQRFIFLIYALVFVLLARRFYI